MRLVCPNCEAKYEVPDDAIPDTGRDVQCANCGHAWFQMRARSGAALSVAEVLAAAMPAEADASGKAPAAVAPTLADPEPEGAAEPAPEVVAAGHPPDEAAAEMAAPDGTPPAEQEPEFASPDAPPDLELAPEPEPAPELEPQAELAPEPELVPEAEPVPEPMVAADPEPVAEIVADSDVSAPTEDPVKDDAAAPVGAANYAVDDSVLAILREEAEREANARRADALESQTDLGIDSAMPRKGAALAADLDGKPSARRDLLPDVEEINSTLRPSETQGEDATDFAASPPTAPRGFRSGFLVVMTVAILGAALYVVAPRLGAMVPSLSGPLESYVSVIDSLRLGLDGVMRSATVAINGG